MTLHTATLRLAGPADAACLSALHAGAFERGWTESDFATWLVRPEAMGVIACRAEEPAAFGLALAAGADAELLTIATAGPHRRCGLARQVFAALDGEAARRGLARWVLEVAGANLPALQLYKSAGFVEIGVRKAYYRTPDGLADAQVMSRRVGSGGGQDRA